MWGQILLLVMTGMDANGVRCPVPQSLDAFKQAMRAALPEGSASSMLSSDDSLTLQRLWNKEVRLTLVQFPGGAGRHERGYTCRRHSLVV